VETKQNRISIHVLHVVHDPERFAITLIISRLIQHTSNVSVIWVKEVRHIVMPKAAPKVNLSFSKTRDDIEMK